MYRTVLVQINYYITLGYILAGKAMKLVKCMRGADMAVTYYQTNK